MDVTPTSATQAQSAESLLKRHLEYHNQLENLIREFFGTKSEVPSSSNGAIEITSPGYVRLIETHSLARRTWSSIATLISLMYQRESEEGVDFTEDAAVLLRRLFDLLAQAYWLVQKPSDDWSDVPPGEFKEFDPVQDDFKWPDEDTRTKVLGHLCAATTWIDAQALRAFLKEIREYKKLLVSERKMLDTLPKTTDTANEQSNRPETPETAELELELTIARLDEMKAPNTDIDNTFDILCNVNETLAVAYRLECDATHGGYLQRRRQRGIDPDGGFIVGKPASLDRQARVLAFSNRVMSELFHIVVQKLGRHVPGLEELISDIFQPSLP